MSEYNELIKHFDRIRSYVRDFYIYGFKTREDFREKSGRTYDNQRRRMESWFSDYIRQDRSGHKFRPDGCQSPISGLEVQNIYG